MKTTLLLIALACALGSLPAMAAGEMEAGFLNPPDDTRPGCYWYFLKDDVTKAGITKDLEAMARAGIGRAFIGYINQGENPAGDNRVLSDIWWERLEHTFVEGARLGVDIGLFNCPGWSQSGGPWNTPERSMRNLVNTEITVNGPMAFDDVLPGRDGYFETVRVLAFPAPAEEFVRMADFGVKVTPPQPKAETNLLKGGSVGFRATLRHAGDPGNPGGLVDMVSVRDAQGRVIFEDDFSDGLKGWAATENSSVSDGMLRPVDANSPPMYAEGVALPAAFSLETRVKLNPGGVIGIAWGVKDGANHAFWQIRKGMLCPHLKINNHYTQSAFNTGALVEDAWMAIRLVCDGATMKTYVDGVLVNEGSLADISTEGRVDALFDNDDATTYTFPKVDAKEPFVLDFAFERPYPVQALIAKPVSARCGMNGELLASKDGKTYTKLAGFDIGHGHQGVKITDPLVTAVPSTSAKFYRLKITGFRQTRAFSELFLSPRAMLDKFVIKQLGDVHPTPHPLYGTYEWKGQAEPASGMIAPGAMVDLTEKMDAAGRLKWDVPAGKWVIARFAMVSTGSKNAPAMPDATGLECDKMSKEHTQNHFRSYIGKILERIPPENRKSFKYIIQDSYETGPQNWTDGLVEIFRVRYHYDPVPYLPVTSGRIVGSADVSERFLWDLRRLVADLIASEYVGGLTQAAEANGLKGWLENYGHWGFPGEGLLYGKNSSEIGGEFWLGGDLGVIENRMPASAAHIYGKQEVFAESFTSGLRYQQTPRSHLKHYGDWAFAEGINHPIFHLYIHQPRDDERPGVDAWFGTNFTRHNTWFPYIGGYVDYVRRVNYMMRRGANVADAAYFTGEGAPKMDGPRTPALPRGYEYDFVNGDVILNHMFVKDGRICIAGGPSYRVLVLPDVDTMRPEIAAKLKAFAKGGAVICGPRPVKSPSLENYPECDAELNRLAEKLWGAGLVKTGSDMGAILAAAGVLPDFSYTLTDPALEAKESPAKDHGYASHAPTTSLRFSHRREGNTDIYFVVNMHQDRSVAAQCTFRVGHKKPEIWDAVTGEIRDAASYSLNDAGVTLPVTFAPQQSFLFVFRTPVNSDERQGSNEIQTAPIAKVDGPWTVRFDPEWGGPAEAQFNELVSWSDREETGIKYYSGTATYETTFRMDTQPAGRVWLDLGDVADLAEVTLNGQRIGIVWVQPWRIEIGAALKSGENRLSINVANTWNNRFYGDKREEKKYTKSYTGFDTNNLLLGGLLGPVTVEAARP